MLIPSSTEDGATGEAAANVFALCEAGPCHTLCCKVASTILKVFKETIGRSVTALDNQVLRGDARRKFIVRDKDPLGRSMMALIRLI